MAVSRGRERDYFLVFLGGNIRWLHVELVNTVSTKCSIRMHLLSEPLCGAGGPQAGQDIWREEGLFYSLLVLHSSSSQS